MRHLPGLADIAADYDGFILDLWGVVHDGTRPYPGAVACLQRLRERDAPILKRAAPFARCGRGPAVHGDRPRSLF